MTIPPNEMSNLEKGDWERKSPFQPTSISRSFHHTVGKRRQRSSLPLQAIVSAQEIMQNTNSSSNPPSLKAFSSPISPSASKHDNSQLTTSQKGSTESYDDGSESESIEENNLLEGDKLTFMTKEAEESLSNPSESINAQLWLNRVTLPRHGLRVKKEICVHEVSLGVNRALFLTPTQTRKVLTVFSSEESSKTSPSLPSENESLLNSHMDLSGNETTSAESSPSIVRQVLINEKKDKNSKQEMEVLSELQKQFQEIKNDIEIGSAQKIQSICKLDEQVIRCKEDLSCKDNKMIQGELDHLLGDIEKEGFKCADEYCKASISILDNYGICKRDELQYALEPYNLIYNIISSPRVSQWFSAADPGLFNKLADKFPICFWKSYEFLFMECSFKNCRNKMAELCVDGQRISGLLNKKLKENCIDWQEMESQLFSKLREGWFSRKKLIVSHPLKSINTTEFLKLAGQKNPITYRHQRRDLAQDFAKTLMSMKIEILKGFSEETLNKLEDVVDVNEIFSNVIQLSTQTSAFVVNYIEQAIKETESMEAKQKDSTESVNLIKTFIWAAKASIDLGDLEGALSIYLGLMNNSIIRIVAKTITSGNVFKAYNYLTDFFSLAHNNSFYRKYLKKRTNILFPSLAIILKDWEFIKIGNKGLSKENKKKDIAKQFLLMGYSCKIQEVLQSLQGAAYYPINDLQKNFQGTLKINS